MREYNNIKIIGVDHGYGNIKTANCIFPTAITGYDSRPAFEGELLEYEGRFYRIGEGHKDFIPDKVEDEDFYLLTLVAMAKELEFQGVRNAEVHLVVGLPMMWVRSQRERFKAYLLHQPDIFYTYNGRSYHIRLVGCSCYPQGYPAVLSRTSELTGSNLLVDIGNGTMNLLYILNGVPQESKGWTEKLGVYQCVVAAQNAVMNCYHESIGEEIIEQAIRTGTVDIAEEYLCCIETAIREYTARIVATLKKYGYSSSTMRLWVVGGGGCLLRHFDGLPADRVTYIDDLCATAKGYETAALLKMRKK